MHPASNLKAETLHGGRSAGLQRAAKGWESPSGAFMVKETLITQPSKGYMLVCQLLNALPFLLSLSCFVTAQTVLRV